MSSPRVPVSYQLEKAPQGQTQNDSSPAPSENGSLCVSSYDEDGFVDEKRGILPQHLYTKWRKAALLISSLSVVSQISLAIASLILSVMFRSPGAFGFAIESALDVFTTLVVIWRFIGQGGSAYSLERERRAQIGIGSLFCISGIAVFTKSVYNLTTMSKPFHPYVLVIVAAISLILYTALAWAKYAVADKLQSISLQVDGLNTVCGAVMAFMLLGSLLVYKYTKLWFLGSSVAIIISIFLFVYGVRTLNDLLGQRDKAILDKEMKPIYER